MFERDSFRVSHILRRASLAALWLFAWSHLAVAQDVTAPGYVYSFVTLGDTTQACVAIGAGGTFVGSGPGFTGNAQSVVFVTPSGAERTVVSGLNSIGDCAYDEANDILYVVDNALEAGGAVTGDTVFEIDDASSATGLSAAGHELLPAGSIPNAFSVALSPSGDVFVSDAAGGGAGSVRKISGGVMTTFAGGFDFTGGLIWDTDLFVAESLASFETQVSRYDSTGAFVEIVSGPGFDHGSFDLARTSVGHLLVTGAFGGPVVALNTTTGVSGTFASGFNFATSIDVDDFTGRVELVSSTFSGADEDFRLHQLTPVARLAPGAGQGIVDNRQECLVELYGVEVALNSRGAPSKKAICTDGAACDADGKADGTCTFPLGICLNLDDERMPHCASDATVSFELKNAVPSNAALSSLAADVVAALPVEGPQCFSGDGIAVPVRTTKSGAVKPGKQLVKLKAKSESPSNLTDVDVVKLVCNP